MFDDFRKEEKRHKIQENRRRKEKSENDRERQSIKKLDVCCSLHSAVPPDYIYFVLLYL